MCVFLFLRARAQRARGVCFFFCFFFFSGLTCVFRSEAGGQSLYQQVLQERWGRIVAATTPTTSTLADVDEICRRRASHCYRNNQHLLRPQDCRAQWTPPLGADDDGSGAAGVSSSVDVPDTDDDDDDHVGGQPSEHVAYYDAASLYPTSGESYRGVQATIGAPPRSGGAHCARPAPPLMLWPVFG